MTVGNECFLGTLVKMSGHAELQYWEVATYLVPVIKTSLFLYKLCFGKLHYL